MNDVNFSVNLPKTEQQVKRALPSGSAQGILKRVEIWDFREDPNGKLVETHGPQRNMITNGGLKGWAVDRPLCENFVIAVAGEGQTLDVRYPEFTLTPGTNITQRNGNSVKVTGTTDTTLFGSGDTLHFEDVCHGDFLIASRTISGGDLQLVLKNVDGSEPTGTTPAGSNFFIYRTSQAGLQTEVARAGTPSAPGSSAGAESDGNGFITGNTDGPFQAGSGGAIATTISGGQVNTVPITSPGSNYVKFAPPVAVCVGGGAGQFITGTVTTTPSDSGTLLNGGSDYSTNPGDVTITVLGPGRHFTGTCTVGVGGDITAINITGAGEAFFADEYSVSAGNVIITDSTGGGTGADVILTPRRQAKVAVCIDDDTGTIDDTAIIYPGYKLTSAPNVFLVNTSYLVHERTFAFEVETGTKNYAEVGFSWAIAPGNNLWARILLRNPTTGAVKTLDLVPGQQLRVTYQVIANYAPTVATTENSALVIGWGIQSGKDCMELIGVSNVKPNCQTGNLDDGLHLNEPYADSLATMAPYFGGVPPSGLLQSPIMAFISDSSAAHSPSGWGNQIARGGGKWSSRAITMTVDYVNSDPTLYPRAVVKTGVWSIAAGNGPDGNGIVIGSYGLGLIKTNVSGPSLERIGYSYVFDAATLAQATNDGHPIKINTHTLSLSFEQSVGRTLAV